MAPKWKLVWVIFIPENVCQCNSVRWGKGQWVNDWQIICASVCRHVPHDVCVCVCLWVPVGVCVCLWVCVSDREREKEKERVVFRRFLKASMLLHPISTTPCPNLLALFILHPFLYIAIYPPPPKPASSSRASCSLFFFFLDSVSLKYVPLLWPFAGYTRGW